MTDKLKTSKTLHVCTVSGCSQLFREKIQRDLHAANTWHCLSCAWSDGQELQSQGMCASCKEKKVQKC